jgi:DNA-binding XRE family transcriptional regulator
LKQVREEQGYSQEELGYRAGLNRTYVGYIEVGKHTPSIYTLYKLSHALGVDLSDIIKLS